MVNKDYTQDVEAMLDCLSVCEKARKNGPHQNWEELWKLFRTVFAIVYTKAIVRCKSIEVDEDAPPFTYGVGDDCILEIIYSLKRAGVDHLLAIRDNNPKNIRITWDYLEEGAAKFLLEVAR